MDAVDAAVDEADDAVDDVDDVDGDWECLLDRLAVDDEDNEVAEIELAFTVVAPPPSKDVTPDGDDVGVVVFAVEVGENRSCSDSISISLGGGGGGAVGK